MGGNNFLFLLENVCCGYSLEAPWQGASNEYPQYMFLWKKKHNLNNFLLKIEKKRHLIRSYAAESNETNIATDKALFSSEKC